MFEEYEFAGVFFQNQALLALYAQGKTKASIQHSVMIQVFNLLQIRRLDTPVHARAPDLP